MLPWQRAGRGECLRRSEGFPNRFAYVLLALAVLTKIPGN